MSTLHLTLKKKWFDMIASGEKKEEYREIKQYWQQRLFDKYGQPKYFKQIIFRNGYSKTAPTKIAECLGIEEATGKEQWGAEPGKNYFVIKLGKIILT